MFSTEYEVTLHELFKELGYNYTKMYINEPVNVSHLNYQILTQKGQWNNIEKIVRKPDSPAYSIVTDDILLEVSGDHRILVKNRKPGSDSKFIEVCELYTKEDNYLLNRDDDWHTFRIEKENYTIPIVDMELDGDHSYRSNSIVSHNTMFGDPMTTPGGKAIPYHASVRLRLYRHGELKSGKTIQGVGVKAKTIKNKIGPPLRQCEFDVIFGKGIDDETAWIKVLENGGFIQRSGAWYKCDYDGEEVKFQSKGWKEMLNKRPELYQWAKEKVQDSLIIDVKDELETLQDAKDFEL